MADVEATPRELRPERWICTNCRWSVSTESDARERCGGCGQYGGFRLARHVAEARGEGAQPDPSVLVAVGEQDGQRRTDPVEARLAEIEARANAATVERGFDIGWTAYAEDVPWLLARLKEHDERIARLERLHSAMERAASHGNLDLDLEDALDNYEKQEREATYVARSGVEPA